MHSQNTMHLIAVSSNNLMATSPPILEFQNKSNSIQNTCKYFKSEKLVQINLPKMKLPLFPRLRCCCCSSNPKPFLHYTLQGGVGGRRSILLFPESISSYCEPSSEYYWYDFNAVYLQPFLFLDQGTSFQDCNQRNSADSPLHLHVAPCFDAN